MLRNRIVKRTQIPYPTGKLPLEDLAKLLARYTQEDPRIIVKPGIGTDATVISFGDRYLVAKTDPITFAIDQIGWYAVNINANDVAAMGGIPRWFLATLLLPEGKATPREVEDLFAQISEACRELEIVLCGGHTEITHGLDRPMVVGQMLGEVEKEKLVYPDRVRPGDEIILTKGIAIEGTALIAREREELRALLGKEKLSRCQSLLRNPGISVVREARIANQIGEVHAMHDPTEGGLATGLQELASAARLGLLVEMEKIPILPETALLCEKLRIDPLGLLASGALLIVMAATESAKVVEALKKEGIPASMIGKVWERDQGVKAVEKGEIKDLPSFARDEVARLFEGSEG